MDCSQPGSSIYGILQVKILEWLPFPSPLATRAVYGLLGPFCCGALTIAGGLVGAASPWSGCLQGPVLYRGCKPLVGKAVSQVPDRIIPEGLGLVLAHWSAELGSGVESCWVGFYWPDEHLVVGGPVPDMIGYGFCHIQKVVLAHWWVGPRVAGWGFKVSRRWCWPANGWGLGPRWGQEIALGVSRSLGLWLQDPGVPEADVSLLMGRSGS